MKKQTAIDKTASLRLGENMYMLVNSLREVPSFKQRKKAQTYAGARISQETGKATTEVLADYKAFLESKKMPSFYARI